MVLIIFLGTKLAKMLNKNNPGVLCDSSGSTLYDDNISLKSIFHIQPIFMEAHLCKAIIFHLFKGEGIKTNSFTISQLEFFKCCWTYSPSSSRLDLEI